LHTNGFSSLWLRIWPFKFKLLVNVLPQFGTGHTNIASCLRRLCDALLVRSVVTFCFDTTIGSELGSLKEDALPGPKEEELLGPKELGSGRSVLRGEGETFGDGYGDTRVELAALHSPCPCPSDPHRSLRTDPPLALR
jgi:hypothetical protein